MKTAIIVSTKDQAGMNIRESLFMAGFSESGGEFDGHKVGVLQAADARLYTTDADSINCENIDERIAGSGFRPELLIFATRHASEAGVRSLSMHTPGNWGEAGLGGEDRKLCIAPASYLKAALMKLDELNKKELEEEGFEVIQECTHHGPFVRTPCMFIEIGSKEEEWGNRKAGKVIAEAIIYLIENEPKRCKAVFGIGGLHHTPEFSKVSRRTDLAVGHVCPKYMLEKLDECMIRQALERNFGNEGEVEVVLDWKGLKQGKEKVLKLLDSMGIGYKKTWDLITF